MVIAQDTRFESHLVKLGTQVGWGCEVLMGLVGGTCQDFLSAQLNDPLLGFLQNFYFCEQLMIYLCYCLALALRAVDGDKFSSQSTFSLCSSNCRCKSITT